METKKNKQKKKSSSIQEDIVVKPIFDHSDITHGSWNYSENTENTIKEENRIKHETLNFSL